MQKSYPIYKSNQGESETEKVYDKLSNANKKAIEKYLEICSINSKSKTRTENRRRAIIRLFDFIEKDWNEIDYSDYLVIAKAISESELGVDARNDERDYVKRFLRESFSDWQTRFKATAKGELKLLKAEEKSEEKKLLPKHLLTELEKDRLLKATTNLKYKALLSILDESAGRSEEILKLRWCDIDFESKLVYLYSIKTKKKRAIPLENAIVHLRRLKNEQETEDNDLIFYSTRKDKQLSNSALNQILQDLAKKTKLKKRIFPYIYRHGRLSIWIRKLSPKTYELCSGHSLEMGLRCYSHLSQDTIISEMKEKVYEVEELSEEKKNELETKFREELEAMKKEFKKDLLNEFDKVKRELEKKARIPTAKGNL